MKNSRAIPMHLQRDFHATRQTTKGIIIPGRLQVFMEEQVDYSMTRLSPNIAEGGDFGGFHLVLLLIQHLLGMWKHLEVGNVQILPINGALTNRIFEVRATLGTDGQDKPANESVLLRIYGEGTDEIIDRKRELHWLRLLSEINGGPRLLGVFANGRFEKWLPSEPLTAQEMRSKEFWQLVVPVLARTHQIISKVEESGRKPDLWERLSDWLDQAIDALPSVLKLNPDAGAAIEALHIITVDFKLELAALKNSIEKMGLSSAFCHNDSQHLNILKRTDKEKRVSLVDFEYACVAPGVYDLANYLCEWAADYKSDEPHRLDYAMLPDYDTTLDIMTLYIDEATKHGYNGTQAAVELEQQVRMMMRVSHLHWGFWSIIQAAKSSIHFDYVQYAVQRLQQYSLSRDSSASTN